MSRVRRATLLSEEGVDSMIAAAYGAAFLSRRDRALLEVLYGSGLRVAEACGLDVEHLDLERGTAQVLGKGGKRRTVPLTRPAVDALRAWLTWRREGPVFRNARDERMDVRLARKIVAKYAVQADLPHSSPHTLRHSCASHMLRRGAYLFNVQDLLGHAHPQTTAVYLHRMPVDRTPDQDYRSAHPRA